mmetsp:Transcript_21683/g.61743  ORF Transcript_21683/g.61743 Transcript_21683/m.61743 type:complete len:139 (+) Transcript_21683:125-541(+)
MYKAGRQITNHYHPSFMWGDQTSNTIHINHITFHSLPLTTTTKIDEEMYHPQDNIQAIIPKEKQQKQRRRFSDEIEVFIIPEMDDESIDELFYTEDEISNFRHEAFLEQCGLSSEIEFDDSDDDDNKVEDKKKKDDAK